MNRPEPSEPSRAVILRNRAEKLEDQINELQSSYGESTFRDGQIRDAVNEKRRELVYVRQILARLESGATP